MAGFLRVFQSVLHALEAAATVAAPIIKVIAPEQGALMAQAVNAAVLIEGVVTVTGAQKAAIVSDMTKASIDLTNGLLASQGKPPLNPTILPAIDGAVKIVVDQLNAVANTVSPKVPTVAAAKA